ncbi:zinc finger, CHC2-family protein [Solidesulfovibrio carbinoliphilus subsp. oakridgensis]|uniref:Zinc finger, CHC2-family protein n=1 Tax=Solidesulfovibrio carbinoliphilus subsp. oakridgensis TaxID=694327 RepID=G7QBJ5_9BACT|nr:CHC2 zinc finger domain-containing protein [Solidesulfovibrio carbinoliphilus]EHJ48858.1 zinc finger, CHC2-family protein [Solidesulfovibrio carbinoliphilus subsp. oakridgensis]
MNKMINDIKSIPIKEVALKLGIKVKGNKANCFGGHDNKTPSLSFTPGKNLWHCFGCGLGGNNIDLVEKSLRCTFKQSLQWFATNFGINIFNFRKTHDKLYNRQKVAVRQGIKKATAEVDTYKADLELYEWIIKKLELSPEGENYLRERGLKEETISYFKLCDIVSPNKLFMEAVKAWGLERLHKAGLTRINRNKTHSFIWWGHNIIIPFMSNGHVTYIQARRLEQGGPKYINISNIQKPMFNLDILRKLKPGSRVYICEGVFDCIVGWQFKLNTVGILGVGSFKDEWVDLFANFNIVIIPDADEAGEAFGLKVQKVFAKMAKVIQIVKLPNGSDLNDFLTEKHRR